MLIPFNYLVFYPKKVKGIIHIGAHELEELKTYLRRNIEKVIWIEANQEKYKFIEKKLLPFEGMCLGKFAAGSKSDKLKLNIANNGQSSSLLDLGTHQKSYPDISYSSTQEVDVIPLDKWIDDNLIERYQYNFVNIDIQGYELEALKGMVNQLKYVDYLYLEVNFNEVYKNCPLLKDIDNFLKKYNFKRVGMYRTNKGWGDAIYVKRFIVFSKIYYLLFVPFWRIINFPVKVFIRLNYILTSS